MSKPKLYTGNTLERIDRLNEHGILDSQKSTFLKETIPQNWPDHCNAWIENAIGYLPIPLGVANDIPINNQRYHLPLAIEETSVIAGLCKMGKLIRTNGTISTNHLTSDIIGQIPFKHVTLSLDLQKQLDEHIQTWIDETNTTVLSGLLKRG